MNSSDQFKYDGQSILTSLNLPGCNINKKQMINGSRTKLDHFLYFSQVI